MLLLQKDPTKRPSLNDIFQLEAMKKKMSELGYSLE